MLTGGFQVVEWCLVARFNGSRNGTRRIRPTSAEWETNHEPHHVTCRSHVAVMRRDPGRRHGVRTERHRRSGFSHLSGCAAARGGRVPRGALRLSKCKLTDTATVCV